MKLKLIIGLAAGLVVVAGFATDAVPTSANATNHFKIKGMSCDGCASGIASELKRAPGVVTAEVSFARKIAVVGYDTNRISAAGLQKVITEAGYSAKLTKP